MSLPCVFCRIVGGREPAEMVNEWPLAVAFQPLNPVTEGHTLIVPRQYVRDVTENPRLSAATMWAAAQHAQNWAACNIITSAGVDATQTVFHLHLHVVPRRPGDGLALPWTT